MDLVRPQSNECGENQRHCAATREVETSRRNNSKQIQEQAVKNMLRLLGMTEVPRARNPIVVVFRSPRAR